MKYRVKVWKLPKIKGIISRILEVTIIALYTFFGSTFLGSPYCGKLPFRELFGIYQDSGKENETTNSRLRVFSVMLDLLFTGFSSCNSTENHANYITKNQISKKVIFGKTALLPKCCVLQYFLLGCHAR